MKFVEQKFLLFLISLFLFSKCCYGDVPFNLPALKIDPIEISSVKDSTYEQESNQSTSLKHFPQNFIKDMDGLFTHSNLDALLIGAPAVAISSAFDDEVHNYFRTRTLNHTAFANIGADIGETYSLIPAVGTLLFIGQHTENMRFRSFSYALFEGYLVDSVLVNGLKQTTRRVRPDLSNKQSFVSGHSTDFFMIGTLLDRYYGHKAGIIGYGLAGYVAASRLKKDVHWLSDVVAGATLGYIVGNTVSRGAGGFLNSEHFAMIPLISPARKEFGVDIDIQLH